MNNNLIEEIKKRVSITDILKSYGFFPANYSKKYLCQFHQDTNPSVSIDRGVFYCFTCGKGWDTVDFVAEYEKCDKKSAIKIIDEKFNLGILKPLNYKERKKLEEQKKQREKEKQKKEQSILFEKTVLNNISKKIRLYEKIKEISKVTKGAYNGNTEWKLQQLFFHAIKELDFLDWLFDILTNQKYSECEYDYIYGTDKKIILDKISKFEIII